MAGVSSCRRCHRDQSDCSCGGAGGGRLRRSARLRRQSDGEDHISALPNDLLIKILAHLGCARAAARTSLVSRRWRGLWTGLPELIFQSRELKPASIEAALARLGPALSLLDIHIRRRRFSTARLFSLFHTAARLKPANLVVVVPVFRRDEVLMLPCLDHTKSIKLHMRHVHLTLPPVGDLPCLEHLSLHLRGVDLGGLLQRCRHLRRLSVSNLYLDSIAIKDLPLLELLFLQVQRQLLRVDIMAPKLRN